MITILFTIFYTTYILFNLETQKYTLFKKVFKEGVCGVIY